MLVKTVNPRQGRPGIVMAQLPLGRSRQQVCPVEMRHPGPLHIGNRLLVGLLVVVQAREAEVIPAGMEGIERLRAS